jgi:enoyl-CoA hydratase/carnithine racemase
MILTVPALSRRDDVFVLDLGEDGNSFTPDYVAELMRLIELVAAEPAPRALVTTASGNSWALGLDLEWIATNSERVGELIEAMHLLDARMLELPVATVAAIAGHAFAGGGLFALAHDFRVMREDRGFFCLPEVDGHISFTPGLTALVRGRLAPQTAHTVLSTGRRYSGPDALAAGIVDSLASAEDVLETSIALAASLADKDPETLGAIKSELYGGVLGALRDADANRLEAAQFAAALTRLR